jgi:hypothetical protein
LHWKRQLKLRSKAGPQLLWVKCESVSHYAIQDRLFRGGLALRIIFQRFLAACLLAILYGIFCVISDTSVRVVIPALVILVAISFDYILSFFCYIYLLVAARDER